MHKLISLTLLIMVLNVLIVSAQTINPDEVKVHMKRVADWQIEHFSDTFSGREKPHHPLDWTNGALYVGMVKWATMAEDDSYFEWLKKIGEDNNWMLWKRKYHADDHTVGQLYCELYRKYGDINMIKPTQEQFDCIIYHPSQSQLKWNRNNFV